MNKRVLYTFEEDLAKRLKNPAFKKAWEDTEPEYLLGKALIEARLKKQISQKVLASKIGTSQAAISRIESMSGNPSLGLLKRIAKALDTQLSISFQK